MRHIAAVIGPSLKTLQPAVPVVRDGHSRLGAMLHMDTKKLGRIEHPSHRVTSNRRDSVEGSGWEFAHFAINDHSRTGLVQLQADARKNSALDLPQAAVAHYAALGVRIERLLTHNGAAERFIQTCLRE